jgi:hypothetical protein
VDRDTALALTVEQVAGLSDDDLLAVADHLNAALTEGTGPGVDPAVLRAVVDRLGADAAPAVAAGASIAPRGRVSHMAPRIPNTLAPTQTATRQGRIRRIDGSVLADDDLAGALIDALAMTSRGYATSRHGPSDAVGPDGDVVARVQPVTASPQVDARDATVSDAAIAAASAEALTAAGGICAPLPFIYSLPEIASAARPVWSLLPRVEARRGGFRYSMPPSVDDLAPGVGLWDHDADVAADPGNPATWKAEVTLTCAAEELSVRLHAVTAHLKVGNLLARWQPELVRSWLQRLEVAHARLSEQTRLTTIIGGSVAVTAPTVLGAARDVFEVLDRLAAATRSRERMDPAARMDVILPGWARSFLRSDLTRQSPGDDAIARADAIIDEALRERNLRATFALDLDPFTGAQPGAGAAVDAWPATMRAVVFAPGTWVTADGGSLDLGTVRTREDIATNDSRIFYEDFEAAFKPSPVPSFVLTATVEASGASQAPVDLLAP